MKISGFTFIRNAAKLHFPVKESIMSVLPICDEFIIAMGDNDDDDETESLVDSIGSDKIKIYHRPWNVDRFKSGLIFADETNFALSQCSGDWCFYIQADEVIHENDLSTIKSACLRNLEDTRVEGLLFNYNHFWGSYEYVQKAHTWYKQEIRIVRNNIGVKSMKDAQSFRIEDGRKLNVKHTNADMFHYGWVRPPRFMQSKYKRQKSFYTGKKENKRLEDNYFNYGPLGYCYKFDGTHPEVMKEKIAAFDWQHQLNFTKKLDVDRPLLKHELLKYRLLSWIENNLNGGKVIFGFNNFKKI